MLISVVIITLNEAENIEFSIKSAKLAAKFPSGLSIPVEIIISDGGSIDNTAKIAQKFADKTIIGSPGRSQQLNAGAGHARGDALVFLHADTLLPKGGLIKIHNVMKDSNIIGGGFEKSWRWNPNIKRSSFIKVLNFFWEGFDNLLIRLFKTFPGDNVIFVRKNIFNELNGYKSFWICEDFDFMRRLKSFGKKKIYCIQLRVLTSARRLEKHGFLKTRIIWFFIYCLWRLGMSSERLRVRFNKYSIEPEKSNRSYLRF